MNKYTLYCTHEQTKKALGLGAPIERDGYEDRPYVYIDGAYLIPTAEQMIGWLEEKGIQISIMFCYKVSSLRWNYDLDNTNIILFEHNSIGYPSRKEAVLAAIDASLEHLTNNKKCL